MLTLRFMVSILAEPSGEALRVMTCQKRELFVVAFPPVDVVAARAESGPVPVARQFATFGAGAWTIPRSECLSRIHSTNAAENRRMTK